MNKMSLLKYFIFMATITVAMTSSAAIFNLINNTGFNIQCKVAAGDENTFGINKILFDGIIKGNGNKWIDSGLASKIIVIAKTGNTQVLEASTNLSPKDRITVGKKYIILGRGVCQQNITSNASDVRDKFSVNYPAWFYKFTF